MLLTDVLSLPRTLPTTQVALQATVGGSNLTFTSNGSTTLYFGEIPFSDSLVTSGRLTAQFDASSYATGVYPVAYSVTAEYLLTYSTATAVDTTPLIIVNGTNSPIGKGWDIAGIQRLWFTNGGYLVTDGDGSAVWFGTTLPATAVDSTKLSYDGTYYYRTLADGTVIRFSGAGQMQYVQDRLGRQTTITYDGSGRVIDITDPMRGAGHLVPYYHLTYGTYGLASITEQGGPGASRVTSITVDANGHVTRIQDPDSYHTDFTYDVHGRLATTTDRRGGVIQYGYDSTSWKLTSQTAVSIPIDNGSGGTTSQSVTVAYHPWQLQGLPPLGKGTPGAMGLPSVHLTSHYMTQSDSATITDALGHTTRLAVNQYGQVSSWVDPLGNTTTVNYLGLLPTEVTWSDSSTTVLMYSGVHLASIISGTSWRSYRYGTDGQIDSVSGSGTPTARLFLNAVGNPDSIRAAATQGRTQTTRFTYDGMGRISSMTDPLGHVTFAHYDPLTGNLDSVLAPGHRWRKTTFDAYGRDSVRAMVGMAAEKILYDSVGRPIAFYDGVNAIPTTITYDPLFRTAVRNPKGELADSVAYNPLGWLTSHYDNANTTLATSYRYNAAGQLTSVTNRRTNRINFQYDAIGRLTMRSYGTVTDTFTYTANGRSSTTGNGVSHIEFGAMLGDTQTTKTVLGGAIFAMTHSRPSDSLGSTNSNVMTVNGTTTLGQWIFHHDTSTGAITAVDMPTSSAGHAAYAYDLLGDVIQGRYGNSPGQTTRADSLYTNPLDLVETSFDVAGVNAGLQRAYAYDSLGRVSVVQAPASAGQSQRTVYGYDGLGRLTAVTTGTQPCSKWPGDRDAIPDSIFGYSHICGIGTTTTYAYDAADNRIDGGGTYSTGNRLLTFGGHTFTYDADGNVTRKYGGGLDVGYGWDELGHLRSITDNTTGHVVQFDYDPLGRIVRRTTNGVVDRYWVWDANQMALELDASLAVKNAYAYAGSDVPVIATTNGTVRYPQQDVLQDMIGTVDSARTVTGTVSYDPWGVQTATSDSTTSLRWKGLHWEAGPAADAGLYYVRSRWYDPAVGRFLSEDPAGITGGMNAYTFVGDDPINGLDPTGTTGVRTYASYGHMNDGDDFESFDQCEFMAYVYDLFGPSEVNPAIFYHACPGFAVLATLQEIVEGHVTQCTDAINELEEGLLQNFNVVTWACTPPHLETVAVDAQRRGVEHEEGIKPAPLDPTMIIGWVEAVGEGLVVGGEIVGETFAAEGGFNTAGRALELQQSIPLAQQGRITMGVGLAEDANGAQQVLIGTSEPGGYLRPGVTLNPGEILVRGTGHAEADIVNHAQQNGLNLLEVGATRPICASCAALIEGAGATPVTPLKP